MIKIHNTLTGKLDDFVSIKEKNVSMYVCGPTVYNYIHIGNARPAVFFDTVRRYFEYSGYRVKYVQNFTDVDDKMIRKANEEGITLEEVANKYINAYFEDTSKLNLKEIGMIRPKATEHIDDMIKIINTLIEKNYAYERNGDVYFKVENYKEKYGQLSKKKIDDLINGVRIDVNEQKDSPLDFALWKEAKDGEPSWASPWGNGRPGWHIECSAMSHKYLGDTFDIHGGGEDLIFPHHENEIAQSKCCFGGEFARYWMHNRYINVNGQKMSKSLGNFTLLRDILKHYEGRVVRLFILGAHYRKPMDFSDQELEQTKTSLERIENALMRAKDVLAFEVSLDGDSCKSLEDALENAQERFSLAMDDDFNTAQGIGAIFELIKALNIALENEKINQNGKDAISKTSQYVKNILEEVLGVKLKLEEKIENLTSDLVELLLDIRKSARDGKNWGLSDKIRDGLLDLGIKIKDGKENTTWTM